MWHFLNSVFNYRWGPFFSCLQWALSDSSNKWWRSVLKWLKCIQHLLLYWPSLTGTASHTHIHSHTKSQCTQWDRYLEGCFLNISSRCPKTSLVTGKYCAYTEIDFHQTSGSTRHFCPQKSKNNNWLWDKTILQTWHVGIFVNAGLKNESVVFIVAIFVWSTVKTKTKLEGFPD